MSSSSSRQTTQQSLINEAQEPASPKLRYEPTYFSSEYIEDYAPGGYHPLVVHDRLGENDRFLVMAKLGWGGFSTVWLCQDTQNNKWRAVKVLQAKASTEDCPELKALHLLSGKTDHPGARHILLPLETFWQDGPNGRHLCLVYPLLGQDVSHLLGSRLNDHLDDPEPLKDVCFKLVEAMDFLHSNGICHGDFKPGNVLFRTRGLEDASKEEVMAALGGEQPDAEELFTSDGGDPSPHGPKYLIQTEGFGLHSQYVTMEIAVTDFGVCYELTDPPTWTGINEGYAAPEICLDVQKPLGRGADLWALANTIASVRTGMGPLESGHFTGLMNSLEDVLGPMPEPYRSAWKKENEEPEGREIVVPEGADPTSLPCSITIEQIESNRQRREKKTGYSGLIESRIGKLQVFVVQFPREQVEKERVGKALTEGIDTEGSADGQNSPIREDSAVDQSEHEGMDMEESDEEDEPYPYVHKHVNVQLSKEETLLLADLFKRVFKYDPQERESAAQLLNHEWFGERNSKRRKIETPSLSVSIVEKTVPRSRQCTTLPEMLAQAFLRILRARG